MRRGIRPFFAWLAILALLFTQIATAAYACPLLSPQVKAMTTSDCDHESNTDPNLCQRHCDDGKVSVDTAKPLAAPDMAVSFFIRPIAVVASRDVPRAQRTTGTATGPPPTRFTVLRI